MPKKYFSMGVTMPQNVCILRLKKIKQKVAKTINQVSL